MRYSTSKRLNPRSPAKSASGGGLFNRVAKDTTAEERRGGVLLVGGNGPRDLAIRNAQADLRLDQLPSYWSHAALILDWKDGARLHQVKGVEVSLDPADPHKQTPERNGVTMFTLDRYADRARYPNLAFGTICRKIGKVSKSPRIGTFESIKKAVVAAALDPNAQRTRYRLWDWLGVWAAHTYAPTRTENPTAAGIPVPGAALCEYAYEAAGIDITPGATAPNACPELIWNAMLWWHDKLGGDDRKMAVWSLVHKDVGPTRKGDEGGKEHTHNDLDPDHPSGSLNHGLQTLTSVAGRGSGRGLLPSGRRS